jgi:hypothetical protein
MTECVDVHVTIWRGPRDRTFVFTCPMVNDSQAWEEMLGSIKRLVQLAASSRVDLTAHYPNRDKASYTVVRAQCDWRSQNQRWVPGDMTSMTKSVAHEVISLYYS